MTAAQEWERIQRSGSPGICGCGCSGGWRVADRPYLMTFTATGTTYPVTAEDVRGAVAEYPVVAPLRFKRTNRLSLRGDDGYRVEIRPATIGGGSAFTQD